MDNTGNGKRILRIRQVISKSGNARATIYQKIKNGTFPKQIKLGPRSVGWLESDIDEWIDSLIDVSPNAITGKL